MLSTRLSTAMFVLLALLTPIGWSDEPKPAAATDQSGEPASPEQIQQWVKELDADSFAARQAATRSLIAAGRPVIDAVAKAAEGESLEVTTRAMEVLTRLYQSEDAATRDAAKAALEKLTSSKNAVAARQAVKALEPPKAPEPAANVPLLPGLPPGFPNVPMIPGGRVSVKTTTVNGVKTVEVDENGKIIKILDDPNNGITVTVTEKVDGKDKTSTYAGKTAEELKKNHPQAHDLYEKYTKNPLGLGNIQLRIGGGIQLQPGQLPGIPVPAPRAARNGRTQAQQKLEQAQKQLELAAAELKKAATNGASADDLKRLAGEIESASRQIGEAQKELAD
jgi:hypothetical protein